MKLKGPTFPHFKLRILAWIYDLPLAFILLSYSRSFKVFGVFEGDVQNIFPASYKALGTFLTSLFFLYIVAVLLRFYMTLLFGRSLGQRIFDIKGQGGFVWKRLGGGARVLLSGILAPLLIDQIPMLMGKKSLSEYLTLTTLMRYPSRMGSAMVIILLPILLVLWAMAPLFENLTIIDGPKTSFTILKKEKIGNHSDFTQFKHYFSNHFSMSSFSSLKNQRFLLIPTFTLLQNKSKKKIRPKMIFYDRHSHTYGHLRKLGDLNLRPELLSLQKKDPLFRYNYPLIFNVLQEEAREFSPRLYDDSYSNHKILKAGEGRELMELMQDVLGLNTLNIFKYIFTKGPFLRGPIAFRKNLVAQVGSSELLGVDSQWFGNYQFLRFKKKANTREGELLEILIPQETFNARIYEYFWEAAPATVATEFKEAFLSSSDWYFDYHHVFSFPKEKKELGPFSIIDFYTEGSLLEKERKSLEDFAYHYMFELCQMAIKTNDEKLQKVLFKALTSFYGVAELINENLAHLEIKKVLYSQTFLKFIAALKLNLQNKDKDFFMY